MKFPNFQKKMKKKLEKNVKHQNHELNEYFVQKWCFYQKHKGNGEIPHGFFWKSCTHTYHFCRKSHFLTIFSSFTLRKWYF